MAKFREISRNFAKFRRKFRTRKKIGFTADLRIFLNRKFGEIWRNFAKFREIWRNFVHLEICVFFAWKKYAFPINPRIFFCAKKDEFLAKISRNFAKFREISRKFGEISRNLAKISRKFGSEIEPVLPLICVSFWVKKRVFFAQFSAALRDTKSCAKFRPKSRRDTFFWTQKDTWINGKTDSFLGREISRKFRKISQNFAKFRENFVKFGEKSDNFGSVLPLICVSFWYRDRNSGNFHPSEFRGVPNPGKWRKVGGFKNSPVVDQDGYFFLDPKRYVN